MKRVVVDPNVLLSALVGRPDAAPAVLLEAIHDHTVEMIACPALIAEVRKTLAEPYFRALLDEAEVEQAVAALQRVAVMRDDPLNPKPVLRDPSDDYLLALAQAGEADAIVTGDKDLLDHAALSPPAIRAREAIERLAND
ncbi:MAG TPA: putative toxin-antitoxin system toxin component, PIN family [Solirubrobacteraceae bacterium]|nr:putative toxin-antitoxin system toxin component, PIN family [Solirubrobacteraceae bacterium]